MNTSPLFKAYITMSSVCAGNHSFHSEVVACLAYRFWPCCGLATWLLQALLVPTGTLGITSHIVGFVMQFVWPHQKAAAWNKGNACPQPTSDELSHCDSTACWTCHTEAAEMSQCTSAHRNAVVRTPLLSHLQGECMSRVESCSFIFEVWRNK